MNERKTIPLSASIPMAKRAYRNWRERYIVPALLGVIVFSIITFIPVLSTTRNIFLGILFVILISALLAVTLTRSPYPVRASVFLAALYFLGIAELIHSGILGDGLIFFIGLVVFATMLFSTMAGMISILASMITFMVLGWLTLNDALPLANSMRLTTVPQDWLLSSAKLILLAGAFVLAFRLFLIDFEDTQKRVSLTVSELDRERVNIEEYVTARTAQLTKITEIAAISGSSLIPADLYRMVVASVSERFDSYFTALYLLDENGQTLDLVDATGEAGQVLKESGHRLELAQKNLVSSVVRENKARLLKPVEGVPPSVDNPLLPYTRSELCLPLYVGERVFGAIDIHSAKDSVFLETDMATFEDLAVLLSNAVANTRSFEIAQQEIKELSTAQQRYIQTSWAALSSNKPIEFRLGEENVTSDANEFKVPLALRDQIIGQISLATESEWTLEQRAMIETIATQAALALENARLVEESQASATHDRIAVDITSKVWSTPSMDGILQMTVRELGRALGASEATIELVEGVKDEL